MIAFLRKLPVPICSLSLGLAGLGLLLQDYGTACAALGGVLSAIIALLMLLKLCLCKGILKTVANDPVQFAALSALPMALMLLSVYAKQLFPAGLALALWLAAVTGHGCIILAFTVKHILHSSVKGVHAVWFLVYVGIAAAAIAAPAHHMQAIAIWLLWFGLLSFALGLGPISYRYLRYREIAPPLQPLFCIFAAPASLCLVGYLQSAAVPTAPVVAGLLALSIVLYLPALAVMARLVAGAFFPTHAAFTFPFVVSATALRQATAFLLAAGYPLAWLQGFVFVETGLAALLCVIVFVRYLRFLTC